MLINYLEYLTAQEILLHWKQLSHFGQLQAAILVRIKHLQLRSIGLGAVPRGGAGRENFVSEQLKWLFTVCVW